jgi:predicted CXXCH cytochrome family protein
VSSNRDNRRDSKRSAFRHCLRWAVPAVVLLGIALGTGCDEVTKYRVLSFFFDGVPPPPGMILANKTGAGNQSATGPATNPASKPSEETVASIHAAYAGHQCTACHLSESSFQAATGVETCGKCHPSYYENKPDDWTHGPVAVGRCSMCHRPHKSPYPGLLVTPQPELCFGCHQSAEVLSRPYHAQAAKVPCSTCHDPHSAGNRLLLADSRTYRRRGLISQKYLASPHAAWNKQQCNNCHLAEHSNQLRPDVNSVCLACHKNVQTPTATSAPSIRITDLLVRVPMHDPVRRGECVSCHTPHRSTRPHLIKPIAEQVCYQCHNSKEIQTAAHPPVHRVDCLLCHTGHSSPIKHLLKPGIESAMPRTMGATSAPSATTRKRP